MFLVSDIANGGITNLISADISLDNHLVIAANFLHQRAGSKNVLSTRALPAFYSLSQTLVVSIKESRVAMIV